LLPDFLDKKCSGTRDQRVKQ